MAENTEQTDGNRKRQIDWTDDTICSPSVPKLSLTEQKERERRKIGLADEIDFDLSEDLSTSGYINEAILFQRLVISEQVDVALTCDDQKSENTISQVSHAQENISGQLGRQSFNNCGIADAIDRSNQEENIASQLSNYKNDINFVDAALSGITAFKECPRNNKTSDYSRFQYVLAAATSIATKSNEETITYLNQGQSYEIKLKKLGDLSPFRGKKVKSIITLCFHERRFQNIEKIQMHQWLVSRPNERILEADVVLSYGLLNMEYPVNPNRLNSFEVMWDPMKEVGVYIKVNCISTEFSQRKRGGEKGVPLRIQVETYVENSNEPNQIREPIHVAACQIKVFKLKGGDRKHKQDRFKIQKRPLAEQQLYQPSYDCTILNDLPNDMYQIQSFYNMDEENLYNSITDSITNGNDLIVSSTNSNLCRDNNLTDIQVGSLGEIVQNITKETSFTHLSQWLAYHRFIGQGTSFSDFSAEDFLRLSKDECIDICGVADGIRLFNLLHLKGISPRITMYVSCDADCYHALYLHSATIKELLHKLIAIPGFPNNLLQSRHFATTGASDKPAVNHQTLKPTIYLGGPLGIRILVTDEVISHLKDESLFTVEVQGFKIVLNPVVSKSN